MVLLTRFMCFAISVSVISRKKDSKQTAFQAIQNGVSTKEIIEHKDEFGWIDRACRDAEEHDLAPCFIVPARKEYMQEQEIMNVRELYPELIGPDGEIIWSEESK